MQVVLLSNDLMLRARLEGAVRKAGVQLGVAGEADEAVSLANDPDVRLLIVDLQTHGLQIAELLPALRAQRSAELAVLAFAPHVHEQRLEAARQAGCDAVVSRGGLNQRLDQLLQRFLAA